MAKKPPRKKKKPAKSELALDLDRVDGDDPVAGGTYGPLEVEFEGTFDHPDPDEVEIFCHLTGDTFHSAIAEKTKAVKKKPKKKGNWSVMFNNLIDAEGTYLFVAILGETSTSVLFPLEIEPAERAAKPSGDGGKAKKAGT